MGKSVLFSVGASILALSAMPTAAYAADEPQAGTDGIADIVVTARRVEENQQRIPLTVTTLNAAVLEKRNVNAVSDLQFSVPNLQIKPSNLNPSQPEFIVRGQRQVLYTDENVTTYVNGAPQNTLGLTLYDLDSVQVLKGPQGTLFGKNSEGGAVLFTTRKPTFDFGAEGAFTYGNYHEMKFNAAVNVPLVNDVLALRVAGQVERRDGIYKNVHGGQDDLANRNNNSIRASLLFKPSDSFENQVTFSYFNEDYNPIPSVIDAAPVPFSVPGFAGVVALLTSQAVAYQSQIGGSAPLVQNGLVLRQGSPFVTAAWTGLGTTAPTGTNPSPLDTQASSNRVASINDTATLRINDDWSVKNIFSYRYARSFDFQEPGGNSGIPVNLGPFLNIISQGFIPGNPLTGYFTNNNTNNYYRWIDLANEFQIIGHLPHLDLISGAFYSHQDQRGSVISTFTTGFVSLYPLVNRYQSSHIHRSSFALFAQGNYDFGAFGMENLKLTAGLRWTKDRHDMYTENFYSSNNSPYQSWATAGLPQGQCNELNSTLGNVSGVNNGTSCYLNGKSGSEALTWTASLAYQFDPNTQVYATTRRGYKAGGPNPTTRALQYAFFGPERITDYEVGLKTQGRLGTMPFRFNIAGFIGQYKNIQTQDILGYCVDQTVNCNTVAGQGTFTDLILFNVGKATIKGVEVEATLKPVPDLTLDVGYSYQVGRYGTGSIVPQPLNAATQQYIWNGNPLSSTQGIDVSHKEFAGVPRSTLTASASYSPRWIPETFAKTTFSANYSYRSSTQGLTVQGTGATPAFGIFGGRISFENIAQSPISLAVWMENIGNKYYRLSCADNLASIGYRTCKWGEPRTYGATLSAKF